MRQVVGIDRRIKRVWVDAALDRLAQTSDEAALRLFIDEQLKEGLPGRESRAKSTAIVLRIWCRIPPERKSLRDRALSLLSRISGQERIWLHWGMTALAYPFFRDTTEVVGRLLALQDDFTTAQVQARLLTTWGDRATSREAARKLMTTLVDWEVLRSTKRHGHFLLARKMTAGNPELQLWLLEALLAGSAADEIEAQQLLRLPEAFPFEIGVGVAELRRYDRFNIHRQGLDMDMVALRKQAVEAVPQPARKSRKSLAATKRPGRLLEEQADGSVLKSCDHDQGNIVRALTQAAMESPDPLAERQAIEDSIKTEFLRTLSGRADRFLQVRDTLLGHEGPFVPATVECAAQFRDGHYLGCIALAQSVLEAVIRHIWRGQVKKNLVREGSFDKQVAALHKKKLLSDEWKSKLEQLWVERHSIHSLRSSDESDVQELEVKSRDLLRLLTDLGHHFFGSTLSEGKLVPAHPEYWSFD
jgi:hypothetical protein